MSSTANRVIKNTGYLYAKMGITVFISLYTTRLILNSLGASDFGIFNIVGGAIAMLGFLNSAMAGATQRFMSYSEGEGNKERQKTIFNVSIVLHLIIAVVLGLALVVAGFFFFNGILNIPPDRMQAAKIVYGSLIVSTMFTVMSVPYDAALNAHENMRYYAIVGIIESLLKLAVAFACVYTSFDKLIVYGALMACIPLVTLTIMRIYCHAHYDECTIGLQRYWDKNTMKEMTGFAGWNFFQSAAAIITNNGVGIVMNMFFGTVINAAQGVAHQICGQLMALTTNMMKAVNPIIVKTEGGKDHKKVLKLASTSSKATFFITSLFALPAIITMPELLKLWLKNVPDYAAFFAQCTLIISMCENLTSGFGTAITASGNIKGISISKSLVKFAYLPISYFMFKAGLNVVSAYCCLVIIQGVINGLILPIFFLKKIFDYGFLTYATKVFIPCITAGAITLVLGELLNHLITFHLGWIITFALCVICNIIAFYVVGLNSDEKDIVQGLFTKVKSTVHK